MSVKPCFIATFVVAFLSSSHGVVGVIAGGVLDEPINDPVLQRVHDQREDKHDECDLDGFVAFSPPECPVADPCDPRQELEEEEDAELHAKETEEVDDRLLEPPRSAWGMAVVARSDRFGRTGEGCEKERSVQDFEKKEKDRNANGCLCVLESSVWIRMGSLRQ
jgi:hypothetical protein